MPESTGETTGPDELPHVESTLHSGLLRARKVELKSGLVLGGIEEELTTVSFGSTSDAADPTRRRYVLQGELGRGGMGVVYKVLDTDLHRTLAMKVALHARASTTPSTDGDPDALERFLEEAQVTGQLDHPGIVPLHELGIDANGRVYFTMRMVRGRNLAEVFELARRGEEGWTEERVLIALVRACEAIAYAHAKGVVHRDLKPANVMTGRFGEVYVMDWGLAKVRGRSTGRRSASESTQSVIYSRRASGDAGDPLQTSHGTIFGTPAYMSPEQARGDVDQLDARSDVYSLGAMLYHYLTGSPPYSHPGAKVSAHTLLQWVLEGPPKPVRKLAPHAAPELAAICEKAMTRDREGRYPDAQAFAEDVRAHLAGRPVSALRHGALARTVRWCQKNRLAAGLLLAVTAGATYGLVRLTSLGSKLVQDTALESAKMKAQILQDVNSFYSSAVAGRVDRQHVQVTHDYAQQAGAIPIPATFLTDLGEKISAHTGGVKVRQYSDLPFTFRAPWALDDFEKEALVQLRHDASQPYYRFEDVGGKPVLRYAIGRKMEATCVDCHNHHPASPKTDWKEGDVRGVLEITRPLEDDVARMERGLRGTMLVVAAIVGGLMLVSVVGILRRSKASPSG